MRVSLAVLIYLMLMLPSAAAEEKPAESAAAAPTEAEAIAATRSLLLVMHTVEMPELGDLQRRFLDSEAYLARIFGSKAEGLGLLAREALVRIIASQFQQATREIGGRARRGAHCVGSVLPDGVRRIDLKTASASLRLFWVRGKTGPLLVDWGTPSAESHALLLQREWKTTKSTPAVFLSDLLAIIEYKRLVMVSYDNIVMVVMMMVAHQIENGWAPYSGKNFVLSLIADKALDRRDPRNLKILFSPKDKERSWAATDLERYKAVSKQALREGTDFSALTSYAGRRNAERDYLITPDVARAGAPLVADLSFPAFAIVGFSNGSVRVMDRAALGLGPEDPIVVGDASKSEILRALSAK